MNGLSLMLFYLKHARLILASMFPRRRMHAVARVITRRSRRAVPIVRPRLVRGVFLRERAWR